MDPSRGHRFQRVCGHLFGKNVTKTGIAKELRCSEGSVRKWFSGAPLGGPLVTLLVDRGISERFLLEGKGEMLAPHDGTDAREINDDLLDHIVMLGEVRSILHGYELEAVRGALSVDDFGEIVQSTAHSLATVGKKTAAKKKAAAGKKKPGAG